MCSQLPGEEGEYPFIFPLLLLVFLSEMEMPFPTFHFMIYDRGNGQFVIAGLRVRPSVDFEMVGRLR